MNTFSEAPTSTTFTATTPNGFSVLITVREDSWDKLIEKISLVDRTLLEKGFKTEKQRFGGQKPQKASEYVEGRICPTCGNKLIYFESKGKKHIKCSNSKYDWKTRKTIGCPFVEWSDSNTKQQTIEEEFPDRPTTPQISLIRKLQDEGKLDKDIDPKTLTKNEARILINSGIQKTGSQ